MKNSKSPYHGHRLPGAVISCAVRWYFRFQSSGVTAMAVLPDGQLVSASTDQTISSTECLCQAQNPYRDKNLSCSHRVQSWHCWSYSI